MRTIKLALTMLTVAVILIGWKLGNKKEHLPDTENFDYDDFMNYKCGRKE